MKRQKLIFNIVLLSLLMVYKANAQDTRKLYFTGLGRVEVMTNAANGAAYDGDTVSTNRSTTGSTLFDLGLHLQPTDYLRVTSIVRLQNQFGAFFGQGSAVQLRQLKVEGLIADRIKYELGDIDLGMTPFTIYNYQDTALFESSLFSLRRQISNYENLNESSDWRVQGAKAKSILFWGDSALAKSEIEGFVVRTRENFNTQPNRFLAGASIFNTFGDFNLGFNYVRMLEQKDTDDQVEAYANDVLSTTLLFKKQSEVLNFLWNTEGGVSAFNRTLVDSSKRKVNDGFVLSGISAKLNKVGLQFGAKYRYVGPNFYSAAAQTLRIDNSASSSLLGLQNAGTTVRNPLLLDRYSQSNMYNPTLSPELMNYLPQYGNVLPYGDATPNRQGFSATVDYNSAHDIVRLEVQSHFLNEINGEYKRAFSQYKIGLLVHIDSLLQIDKSFELCASLRNENTSTPTAYPIDFTTNLMDVGVNYEVIDHLHLLLGMKMLTIKGNEFMDEYDELNQVNASTNSPWDEQQQWLAWGLQYDFSTKSFFTVHGNYALYQDKLINTNNYDLNQYYINYTLRF